MDIPESYFIEGMNGKFTQQGLERSILNFNEMPGIEGKVTLKPGDDIYSTRIVLDVKEGTISFRNYFNR